MIRENHEKIVQLYIYFFSDFPECWKHVNARKAIFPKFFALLRAGVYGSHNTIYPSLLPFISLISPEVNLLFSIFMNNLSDKLYVRSQICVVAVPQLILCMRRSRMRIASLRLCHKNKIHKNNHLDTTPMYRV